MAGNTILVVEDDLALQEGVRSILEAAGYRVISADNGLAGLTALEQGRVDLIVSDIMMPEMDGYQFCEAVRSRPEWLSLPFVFLTARGDKADVRLGKRLGADDYLTKPFEKEDLLVAIGAKLRRQTALDAAREAEMGALKRAILTTLSHEFRTPLSYVVSYTDLLAEGGATLNTEEFHTLLRGLQTGVARLFELVEDFMLLVSLLTGEARLLYQHRRTRTADICPFLQTVLESFRERAQARRVALELECPADLPAIYADLDYLEDALGRLIDNGIKFSKKGGGRVRLTAEPGSGPSPSILLTVTDEGIGIAAEHLPRLFDLFYQIDRRKMEQQGTGSGLAICKRIIEMHGGSLSVTSQAGVGSTFVVKLPAGEQEESRFREDAVPPLPS